MIIIFFLVALAALVLVVLVELAACMRSSQISRMEEKWTHNCRN